MTNMQTLCSWCLCNLPPLCRSACCGGGSCRHGPCAWHREKLGEAAQHQWNHEVQWTYVNTSDIQQHSSFVAVEQLVILSVCLSAQCRAPFASELDVSHRHEGRDGGDAGIHLLPGRREFRQSLAVSAHSPVFTDHTATTPLLSPAHPVYWSCLSQ